MLRLVARTFFFFTCLFVKCLFDDILNHTAFVARWCSQVLLIKTSIPKSQLEADAVSKTELG